VNEEGERSRVAVFGCMVLTDTLWIDMSVFNVKCHVVPIHLTDVFLLWYVTAGE